MGQSIAESVDHAVDHAEDDHACSGPILGGKNQYSREHAAEYVHAADHTAQTSLFKKTTTTTTTGCLPFPTVDKIGLTLEI